MIRFYGIVIFVFVILAVIATIMSIAVGNYQYVPLYIILIIIALGVKALVMKMFGPYKKKNKAKDSTESQDAKSGSSNADGRKVSSRNSVSRKKKRR